MTAVARGAAAAVLGTALMSPAALADVRSTRSADAVARAIVMHRSQLVDARWVKLPPRGRPAAIASTRLVGFPRAGGTYAVLSSGDATKIDDPNAASDTSADDGGPSYRGTRDATVLRVDVRAPAGANCLSVVFRFLSDEFNEYVGTNFNDGFIAEINRHSWRSVPDSPTVRAPHNFAFDREKHIITINSTGDFSVTADRARGTTYDAATRRLRASRRVRPGVNRVYLSIFDQGDRQYDSSVALDRLTINNRRPCTSGAALD